MTFAANGRPSMAAQALVPQGGYLRLGEGRSLRVEDVVPPSTEVRSRLW